MAEMARLTLCGHQRALPVPVFDKYDTAGKSGGNMMRRASIGIVLLALSHLAFANASSALAQAGSTGGTIGKQEKSISGARTRTGRVPQLRSGKMSRPGVTVPH
jgi:hypothetical protein